MVTEKRNECKYCSHNLDGQDDEMICSECNAYQGKTEEDKGEEQFEDNYQNNVD